LASASSARNGVAGDAQLVVEEVSQPPRVVDDEGHPLGQLEDRPAGVEEPGDLPLGVGDERERNVGLGREVALGLVVVGGDAHHRPAECRDLCVGVAKLQRFLGSTGGEGLGKEVEHHRVATLVGESEILAARGQRLKVGGLLAEVDHEKPLPRVVLAKKVGYGPLTYPG
jgi:hypothetical protein